MLKYIPIKLFTICVTIGFLPMYVVAGKKNQSSKKTPPTPVSTLARKATLTSEELGKLENLLEKKSDKAKDFLEKEKKTAFSAATQLHAPGLKNTCFDEDNTITLGEVALNAGKKNNFKICKELLKKESCDADLVQRLTACALRLDLRSCGDGKKTLEILTKLFPKEQSIESMLLYIEALIQTEQYEQAFKTISQLDAQQLQSLLTQQNRNGFTLIPILASTSATQYLRFLTCTETLLGREKTNSLVKIKNKFECDALFTVIENKNTDAPLILKDLLERGLDPNEKVTTEEEAELSILSYAIQKAPEQTIVSHVSQLQEYGARSEQSSLIRLATRNDLSQAIVQKLFALFIANDAKDFLVTSGGKSVLDYAVEHKNTHLISLLLETPVAAQLLNHLAPITLAQGASKFTTKVTAAQRAAIDEHKSLATQLIKATIALATSSEERRAAQRRQIHDMLCIALLLNNYSIAEKILLPAGINQNDIVFVAAQPYSEHSGQQMSFRVYAQQRNAQAFARDIDGLLVKYHQREYIAPPGLSLLANRLLLAGSLNTQELIAQSDEREIATLLQVDAGGWSFLNYLIADLCSSDETIRETTAQRVQDILKYVPSECVHKLFEQLIPMATDYTDNTSTCLRLSSLQSLMVADIYDIILPSVCNWLLDHLKEGRSRTDICQSTLRSAIMLDAQLTKYALYLSKVYNYLGQPASDLRTIIELPLGSVIASDTQDPQEIFFSEMCDMHNAPQLKKWLADFMAETPSHNKIQSEVSPAPTDQPTILTAPSEKRKKKSSNKLTSALQNISSKVKETATAVADSLATTAKAVQTITQLAQHGINSSQLGENPYAVLAGLYPVEDTFKKITLRKVPQLGYAPARDKSKEDSHQKAVSYHLDEYDHSFGDTRCTAYVIIPSHGRAEYAMPEINMHQRIEAQQQQPDLVHAMPKSIVKLALKYGEEGYHFEERTRQGYSTYTLYGAIRIDSSDNNLQPARFEIGISPSSGQIIHSNTRPLQSLPRAFVATLAQSTCDTQVSELARHLKLPAEHK